MEDTARITIDYNYYLKLKKDSKNGSDKLIKKDHQLHELMITILRNELMVNRFEYFIDGNSYDTYTSSDIAKIIQKSSTYNAICFENNKFYVTTI